MVISVDVATVNNGSLVDYLTSEVALEEPEIGSTDANISIVNSFTDDQPHLGMPAGSVDYEDEYDESDECNVISTASQWRRPATELERFRLGTSDVDRNEGEDGDDGDADEEEDTSQADDESMQNVEDWGHSRFHLGTSDVDRCECEDGDNVDADEAHWGHSTRECEDWTVYFRPVNYNNGEANATVSDVSEVKTVLQYMRKS